ncbi:MAG: hypothetical protein JRI25_10325, partial [Deltaproteobacteria bacterium]|nr:hypothetical protein [Deltaproteobacteria bacterium]
MVLLVPLLWGACKGEPDDEEVRPPSAPLVSIAPDPATSSDDLVAVIEQESSDPDGRSVSYRYDWDSGVGGTATGETLSAWQTTKGQTWTVVVTPDNGVLDGPSTEASIAILNSVPSIGSVSILPGTAFANTDLRCNPEGLLDADGDTVNVAYAWMVGETAAGTTDQILPSSSFDRYDEVFCTATPSDDESNGNAISSLPIIINNRPPSITSAAVTPVDPTTDATLTCTSFGWEDLDGDNEGYLYEWTVQGIAAGGDANTLSGTEFAKHDQVTCTVTPTDGADYGLPGYADPVLIENTPPSITGVSLDPDPAYTDSVIDCLPTGWSDADSDLGSYLFAWTVDGDPVGGNESSLYGTADFDRGEVVVCTVTPTDGEESGPPFSSEGLTIGNSLPATTAVTVTPNPANTNSFLTCNPAGTDPDGDEVAFDYAWTVEGIAKGSNFNTLSASHFAKGDDVICTATSKDAFGSGTALASAPLTIGNVAPSIASVAITPEVAPSDGPVTCVPSGWFDDDGDDPGYRYAWTVNGFDAGGDSDTLAPEHFSRYNAVICTVTPTDSTDDGAPVSSEPRTISNGAPTLESVSITTESPTTNTNVLCAVSGWFDPDGDNPSWDYAWTV